MDPKSEHYKITFKNQNDQIGFKFFFNDRDLLDYLKIRPCGALILKLEQYDRETNTFQLIK